jgi:hypothetical protein
MVGCLRGRASDRKLRLFACAFWRWFTEPDADPEMLRALEHAERWAEAGASLVRSSEPLFDISFRWHPLFARDAVDAANWTVRGSATMGREWIGPAEQEQQVVLLREMFGNLFHPARIDPAWLRWNHGSILKIAAGIYEERAFDRLPILHDALLDAGCDDEDILAHCRGAGPHVRGCWVVDLLLAKA